MTYNADAGTPMYAGPNPPSRVVVVVKIDSANCGVHERVAWAISWSGSGLCQPFALTGI